jgi:hypothetical protein
MKKITADLPLLGAILVGSKKVINESFANTGKFLEAWKAFRET